MDNVILTQATKEDIISEITNNVLSGVSALLKESRQSELNSKENLDDIIYKNDGYGNK